MIGRFLSYACFLLAFPLLMSVIVDDCNDTVADGHRDGNTIVSRLAGVNRYRHCEHVDTIHHGGSEWEWVWDCDVDVTLVPKGTYMPLEAETIRRSSWLRFVAAFECWHELVLGLVLAFTGFVMLVRSLPPVEPSSPPIPRP